MFVVWSQNGGPLQYISLGLFLLQIIPRISPDISPLMMLALVTPGAIGVAIFHAIMTGELSMNHIAAWRERTRLQLSRVFGMDVSTLGISFLISMTAGGIMALLMALDAYWLSAIFQVVALAVATYAHFYAFGPGAAHDGRRPRVETAAEREARHSKMKSIAEQMQKMPVESFVSQASIHETCSIAALKQMLRNRGVNEDELKSFKDRTNLEQRIDELRRFSESCCICFESYEEGEPLRILSNCHHELHVECLDKWAYTFSSLSKLQQDPTCPLCKTKI